MKYVAVTCNYQCDELFKVIEQLLGRVIFVDVDGRGIPGTAIVEATDVCLSISDKDLQIANPKKVVNRIIASCGLGRDQIRGLGDVIAKLTGLFGIKPCGGCKQRQDVLNKLMPIGG